MTRLSKVLTIKRLEFDNDKVVSIDNKGDKLPHY